MIRDFLNWGILATVVVVSGFLVYQKYENTRPCTQTIHYAIGDVDPRFGISKTAVVDGAKAATAIWDTAAKRTLFVYDPQAALKVNLIYDERAANAKLGARIAAEQAAADNDRAAIDAQQVQYTIVQDNYNKKVTAINARGGATQAEAATLSVEREALSALGSAIDAQVRSYNKRLSALNKVVEEYNKIAGRPFEEGQYVRDEAGERINIFEFANAAQLKRVLAHEFGHALGLNHNDDPKAIMYAKNESGNLAPTAADLSALEAVCGA